MNISVERYHYRLGKVFLVPRLLEGWGIQNMCVFMIVDQLVVRIIFLCM